MGDGALAGVGSDLTPDLTPDLEFDPFSGTFFEDPYPTYRRMRDESPVYHHPALDFYALSRYDDVAAGQKDFASYSSAFGIELAAVQSGRRAEQPMIIMMDPPDHRRMRSLVNRVFTPRAIARLEPLVHDTISRFLNRCDPAGFDAVHDWAALFPVEIISELMGVPEGDRQQIRLWLDRFLLREEGHEVSPEGRAAAVEMGTYYYGLIQERSADPRADMLGDLLRVEIERHDGGGLASTLTDIEIAGFLTLLVGAGAETVTKLVGNLVVTLAEQPDQWRLLRSDRSLIPAAVEESLRHQAPSQYNVRRAMQDVALHGTVIPEGSPVMMLVGSANRDERVFPDPDRFDLRRGPDLGRHIGFGYGIHSCLGAALARLEGRIALDLLLDHLPAFEVDRAGLRRVAMTNVAGYSHVPVRRNG